MILNNDYIIVSLSICILLLAAAALTKAVKANHHTEDQHVVVFSHGGEMDMYEDGDHFGRKMTIGFDGNLKIYDRTYRTRNKESDIEDVEIYSGSINSEELDTLITYFEKSGFTEVSRRLPSVDPREVQIREPAESIEIIFKADRDAESHTVRANMGADRQHYPEKFLELNRELRNILRSKIE